MILENMYFFHTFIVVFVGGLIGESVRTPENKALLTRTFVINVMGIAFLAFFLSWSIYERTKQYSWSLIAAGFISFQSIHSIKKWCKKIAVDNLQLALKVLENNKGEADNEKLDQ